MGRKKKEKRKFEVGGHVLVCGEELPYSEFWYSMKKEIRVPVSDFLDACRPANPSPGNPRTMWPSTLLSSEPWNGWSATT